MLQIFQGFVDLLVGVTLGDELLQFDPALLRHLKHFVDVVGLPA